MESHAKTKKSIPMRKKENNFWKDLEIFYADFKPYMIDNQAYQEYLQGIAKEIRKEKIRKVLQIQK
jgi:hypothetical protein